MDPFVQAARRFSARSAVWWKVQASPLLRAVAATEQRGELVDVLRWEEAQIECRRPLVVVEAAFEEARGYFEEVSRRVLEEYGSLRAAAEEAEIVLPKVTAAESTEPVVQAVKTAELAAAGLPATLDGLMVVLSPARTHSRSEWAESVGKLLRAATALSGVAGGGRVAPVRWIVGDHPGGPLATVLGDGVELDFDEGALFAWLRSRADKPAVAAAPARAGELAGVAGVLSAEGATALRRHVLAGAEALRARAPRCAVESFRAARGICAAEGCGDVEAGILLALGGAQLAAAAPGDAAVSYRAGADLAATRETWTLACQAKLGEAGAELLQERHSEAATAYVEAAGLAEKAAVAALRLEALRMAGVCHLLGGDRQQAVRLWQTVVEVGLGLDRAAREPTSFAQAANDLVTLLERLGMKLQAFEVKRRIAEANGAELEEEADEPEAERAVTTGSEPDVDTTQAPRIVMPRKALPFVAGTVDLSWLDAMVRAAELGARAHGPESADVTQEIRTLPETAPTPFERGSADGTDVTQAIRVLRPEGAIPFVPGSVDPALFARPAEDARGDAVCGREDEEME